MKNTYKLFKQADDIISSYIFNGFIKPDENIVISYRNEKRYSRFLSTRDQEYMEFEDLSKDRFGYISRYTYDKQNIILRSLCRQKGINYLFDTINEYLTFKYTFYDYVDDYDFVANYDAHVFYLDNIRLDNSLDLNSVEYENLIGVEFNRDEIYKTTEK